MKTFQIAITKANATLAVDFASLPEASKAYIIEYGLKQCLNDAHSGSKAATEEHNRTSSEPMGEAAMALIMAEKRLKSIQAGTMGTRNSGDALSREVRAMLADALRANWTKLTPAERLAKVQAVVAGQGNEKAQAILAEAKRRVAKTEALGGDDLGL